MTLYVRVNGATRFQSMVGIDDSCDSTTEGSVSFKLSGDGRTLEGIISERDIVRGLGRIGPGLLSKHVRDLMTVNVLVCVPDDRAAGIMALMVSRHVRHLPVVADGNLVGMVTVHDLLHLRLEETLSEAEAMRQYIAGN
jgi:CBS domain-containing protein